MLVFFLNVNLALKKISNKTNTVSDDVSEGNANDLFQS